MAFETTANDPPGLRTGVTAEQLALAKSRSDAQRAESERIEYTALAVAAIAVCLGLGWVIRRRSRIAATAEGAAIEVAARGLIAKNEAKRAFGNFGERVRNRAQKISDDQR